VWVATDTETPVGDSTGQKETLFRIGDREAWTRQSIFHRQACHYCSQELFSAGFLNAVGHIRLRPVLASQTALIDAIANTTVRWIMNSHASAVLASGDGQK
jgi:hypothetical protein